MHLGDRVARIERARYDEAAAAFRDCWRVYGRDAAITARDHAAFRAAGYDATSLDDLRRWDEARPPEVRAFDEALEVAVFGLVEGAHGERAIRAALAALAPAIGLAAHDPAARIIAGLQAAIEDDMRRGHGGASSDIPDSALLSGASLFPGSC